MENSYYVYLHVKRDTGEPFYVGKGIRKRAYEKGKRRSSYWHRLVNKYGYDVFIIESNLTESEAYQKEKYWIKRIGRISLNEGTLINMTDGGDGCVGFILSDETREKIRLSKLGDKNPMYGKTSSMKGKKFPDEVRHNMSKAKKEYFKHNESKRKGVKRSEESILKMTNSLKEYYKHNRIHNFKEIELELQNKIIEDYQNGVKQFVLHKKYNLSRRIIKRIVEKN